ncbi:MAG: glycosyl hydrolase [Planctomycetota bacterium]
MPEVPRPKHKLHVPRPKRGAVTLLIGTRKGAFALRSDAERQTWSVSQPWFLGSVIHHIVLDPRDGATLLAAARTGHLGPTIYRSEDKGKTWKESRRPPAFDVPGTTLDGRELAARVVNHTFWLAPGHENEPNVWYAGTSPQGLFKSTTGGKTWLPVNGFNQHPDLDLWTGGEEDGTPDGPKLHSILVDPRDAQHLYIGLSSGGVFETTDGGKSWAPLNAGCAADFLPGPTPEFGHDPHCVVAAPSNPDRLWQQNHCGIYRMDREEGTWVRVGANLPTEIGDIGFPIVVSPFDPDTAWVFPMDGTDVWPRTAPGGAPAVWRTTDAGQRWERQDRGFPNESAWWTVKRQCLTHDRHDPLGLYLGTTNGEVWGSINGGRSWKCLARHLPHIYSLSVAGA